MVFLVATGNDINIINYLSACAPIMLATICLLNNVQLVLLLFMLLLMFAVALFLFLLLLFCCNVAATAVFAALLLRTYH